MEIARIFEAMEIARNSSFKVYEKLIDVFYAVPAIFRSNAIIHLINLQFWVSSKTLEIWSSFLERCKNKPEQDLH